jgi:hypothetical protein
MPTGLRLYGNSALSAFGIKMLIQIGQKFVEMFFMAKSISIPLFSVDFFKNVSLP